MKLSVSALILLAGAFLFNPTTALATVKVVKVDGASHVSMLGLQPTIYGGIAGDVLNNTACISLDGITPCDGCASAIDIGACNRRRIDPTLKLEISIISDTAVGNPILSKDGLTYAISKTTIGMGQIASLWVTWGTACFGLQESTFTCHSSLGMNSGVFKVGFDANYNGQLDYDEESQSLVISVLNPDPDNFGNVATIDDCAAEMGSDKPGICNFTAYPGNKKIFVADLEAQAGFPYGVSGPIAAVNVYASEGSFITSPAQVKPLSFPIVVLKDGSISLPDSIVKNVKGDTPYFLRVSVEDLAGNEMLFTSDTAIMNVCGSLTPAEPYAGTCRFAAVPTN